MATQARAQIRSDFFLAWVASNTVGLTLAGITFAVFAWWPLVIIGSFLGKALGSAVSGILIGVIAGVAQWLVLRRYLRTSIWWVGTSAVGWAFVGIALWSMNIPAMTDVGFTGFSPSSTIVQWAVLGAILGLATSVWQMMILPLHGSSIGLWLFFNTIGWAIALAVSWPIAVSTHMLVLGPLGCISGALGGAISGIALTWLLRDTIRPKLQSVTHNVPEQVPSKNSKAARFTAGDRIGGIGVFGIVFSLLALAVGESTLGTILLGGGVVLLAYSIVTKRRA